MKTRAQELGVTEFPYREYDESGDEIYSGRKNVVMATPES
jgi:hypothetical protein